MRSPEAEVHLLGFRKDALLAVYAVRAARWQGVENACLASLAVTYAGLFTRTLEPRQFLLVALFALVMLLMAVRLEHRARDEMQQGVYGLLASDKLKGRGAP
jgi:hypothetical protein